MRWPASPGALTIRHPLWVDNDDSTADDRLSIDRAAEELVRRGWSRRFSLNQVVNGWSSLVHLVETGYEMTIDDYTNDLRIRRWAAEVEPLLTPRVRRSFHLRLEPIDEQFRKATFEAVGRLPGAGTDHWWETRLPLHLVGELAEDVERMDLRPPLG